jgi:hypothetical protein
MLNILASGLAMLALVGVVAATTVSAQEPSKSYDGSSLTTVGPARGASMQKTQDGNNPTMVGTAIGAYRQFAQGSPPMVGPASKAYKGD